SSANAQARGERKSSTVGSASTNSVSAHRLLDRFAAALPVGASSFLRDFGLAVFVGIVGIGAGPQALTAIEQYGLTLFVLGVAVTLIPQIVAFFFSYFVLRIKNPIEAL